jgi:hypothetical protein
VFTDAVKTFQTLSSLLYLMCVTEAKVSNQKGVEQCLYAIYSYKMMNSSKFKQICVNMDLKKYNVLLGSLLLYCDSAYKPVYPNSKSITQFGYVVLNLDMQ